MRVRKLSYILNSQPQNTLSVDESLPPASTHLTVHEALLLAMHEIGIISWRNISINYLTEFADAYQILGAYIAHVP